MLKSGPSLRPLSMNSSTVGVDDIPLVYDKELLKVGSAMIAMSMFKVFKLEGEAYLQLRNGLMC